MDTPECVAWPSRVGRGGGAFTAAHTLAGPPGQLFYPCEEYEWLEERRQRNGAALARRVEPETHDPFWRDPLAYALQGDKAD